MGRLPRKQFRGLGPCNVSDNRVAAKAAERKGSYMKSPINDKATSVDRIVHTPGPWEAYYVASAGWSVRMASPREGYDRPDPICSMAWWQFDKTGVINNDISGANAKLIAAAPDLLRACELVELWMLGGKPGPHSDSAVLAQVRDAIHKAKTKVV